MLIGGDGKTLRPVKCFIREEKVGGPGHKTDLTEVEQGDVVRFETEKSSGNPFIPGGAVSEDGAKILELWRLDRLGQYGNNCHQVTSTSTSSLSP